MKKYNLAIIDFMKGKGKLLKFDKYFSEKDEKSILKWNSEKAKAIWLAIEDEVKYQESKGLTFLNCPFCIYKGVTGFSEPGSCNHCVYAKHHHGKCFGIRKRDDLSSWIGSFSKRPDLFSLLSNKRLQKIINTIKKKYEI